MSMRVHLSPGLWAQAQARSSFNCYSQQELDTMFAVCHTHTQKKTINMLNKACQTKEFFSHYSDVKNEKKIQLQVMGQ